MRAISIVFAVGLAGCATTTAYENVADFKLYEADDPEGYQMLQACLGSDGTFDRKLTREEAASVGRLSDKINSGRPLTADDFEGVPCAG